MLFCAIGEFALDFICGIRVFHSMDCGLRNALVGDMALELKLGWVHEVDAVRRDR